MVADPADTRQRLTHVGQGAGLHHRIEGSAAVAVGIFAGMPVQDYAVAVGWYTRLLGSEPAFFPNDVEAVWRLADSCHLYVIQDPQRAGGVCMLWVDDPASEVDDIAARGLEPTGVEKHDGVRKYVFQDADGNEVGIGGEVEPPGEPARARTAVDFDASRSS
jgi:catechol 2,3-dioxygenase-like lactoylglutathione lyase family enzyme